MYSKIAIGPESSPPLWRFWPICWLHRS